MSGMRDFVKTHSLVPPNSDAERARIARDARLPISQFRGRAHTPQQVEAAFPNRDEGQATPGLPQKSIFTPSVYSETTTTVAEAADIRGQNGVRRQPSFASSAHQDEQVADISSDAPFNEGEEEVHDGEVDTGSSDEDDDVPNDDRMLSAMVDELGHKSRRKDIDVESDFETDARGYPATTSGRLTNTATYQPTRGRHSPDLPNERSLPPVNGSPVPIIVDRNHSRGLYVTRHRQPPQAVTELDDEEQRRMYASLHRRQNAEAFHKSAQLRQQEQRSAQQHDSDVSLTNLNRHRADIGSPHRADNTRPPSLPLLGSDVAQNDASLNSLQQDQHHTGDSINKRMTGDILPVRSSSQQVEDPRKTSEDAELEYEVATLYAMPYNELASDAFDKTHSTGAGGLVEEESSLKDQLLSMASRNGGEQQKFFENLTIEEWEHAGSWFSDQFAQLMQQLQKSRQQRRALAQQFEGEITKHHEAIVKEQQTLLKTLKEMRTSGKVVLQQSTPKRKR